MLLSRVADQLYWGARYVERAQDTARLVRSYTDLVIDLPRGPTSVWEPLIAFAGSRTAFDAVKGMPRDGADTGAAGVSERDVVRFLIADSRNPGCVVASVARARENLRTTREVLPREAWQTTNDLYLFTVNNGEAGIDRRSRSRILGRVIADCQRLDGVMSASMSRDEAYEMWRLGQTIERADMTTRIVGVRAAALLAMPAEVDDHDEVQWMGLLRSLSALQMYQRSASGPISGERAVRFLLFDAHFPRSVASCLGRIRLSLTRLPHSDQTLPAVELADGVLDRLREEGHFVVDSADGAALDASMDRVQAALDTLHFTISEAFGRGGG